MPDYTLNFDEINMDDIARVGGKNAALGEMISKLKGKGIRVPDGFATTSQAYWELLDKNNIRQSLTDTLGELDTENFTNLRIIGERCRKIIMQATIPEEIKESIKTAYKELNKKYKEPIQVAVRSSATAEDLPEASFAGQQESYLNVFGETKLIEACKKCYASLFTDRAIKYREDHGFEHMNVALSIGVQKMVRSDKACAGVGFTIDTESGFERVIFLTGSWGLGENIVQGNVNPDEFYVFKPSLKMGKKAVISKKLGTKATTMIYGEKSATLNIDTPMDKKKRYILEDKEIEKLASWAMTIEEHYKKPMDIEWAKDGLSGELYILQARPETVHAARKEHYKVITHTLKEKGKVLVEGKSIGSKIAAGKVRILHSPDESDKLKAGEVLVTKITNPDWDPIMKRASAIITNRGGRTSHAAIVAREIGAVAVVGTGNATNILKDGEDVTVSCAEGETGVVYEGILDWEEQEIDTKGIEMPNTEVMMILGDPDQAFRLSFVPNNGVGLMRLEFIINNSIKIHPMALVKFNILKDKKAKMDIEELTYQYNNKQDYFIEKLSEAVAMIAAAFYPKDVIVRMSDFKTNEYANLIGGQEFEPEEENPMLGFRGASRYYNPRYKDGFKLECEAIKVVRDEMGLNNVKLMIPFCRTVEEGRKVIAVMEECGLKRGENGLEVYVMTEIPSNAILAEDFAKIFDGFSIGTNDLTQLTLGVERDSEIVSDLFNEKDEAVKNLISKTIEKARKTGTKVGLCGQAPSDHPEFAKFLVEQGIDSISFNPDALVKGIENIKEAEKVKQKR